MAKEDSLLLPPELLHDPERTCDKTRRRVALLFAASERPRNHFRYLVSFLRGRYKRDGSDVLGLMHFNQRNDYLLSQVQWRVIPLSKSSIFCIAQITHVSSNFSPGRFLPADLPAVLPPESYAEAGGAVAGFLLRVNGYLRGIAIAWGS
jgi:hypothetical protein